MLHFRFHEEIRSSFPFPPKSSRLLDDREQQDLYEKNDPARIPPIAKPEAAATQIKKLFRNRQPGWDSSTIERFRSILNGGKAHNQLKQQLLEEYAYLL